MTGDKRSPVLPDVPTMAEAGVQGMEVYAWQGIAAPKNLPADVKSRLHAGIVKALQDPAVTKSFTDAGLEIVANSPEDFTQFQAREYARWKQVIESGGITAQ